VETEKTRIDKWLWAVRLFKTRSLAAEAVQSGKVRVEGESVKPSFQLTAGKTITVRKGLVTYTYKVKGILSKRVGAPLAQEKYDDLTPQEELDKLDVNTYMPSAFRPRGTGRPTKKERRDLDQLWDNE
jgi:ribosome-associated heat shock protein Hsp15